MSKKIKLASNSSSILILFLVMLFSSCGDKSKIVNCNFELDTILTKYERPTFFIEKSLGNCKYEASFMFYVDSINLSSTAIVYKESGGLSFEIQNPKSSVFKLFDFKVEKGKTYEVAIPFFDQPKEKVKLLLENKYNFQSDDIVYKFILLDGYNHLGDFKLDQVIFLSRKKGFIGSYFKDKDEESHIISPQGNILRDVIDYSNTEVRLLK